MHCTLEALQRGSEGDSPSSCRCARDRRHFLTFSFENGAHHADSFLSARTTCGGYRTTSPTCGGYRTHLRRSHQPPVKRQPKPTPPAVTDQPYSDQQQCAPARPLLHHPVHGWLRSHRLRRTGMVDIVHRLAPTPSRCAPDLASKVGPRITARPSNDHFWCFLHKGATCFFAICKTRNGMRLANPSLECRDLGAGSSQQQRRRIRS